MGSEHTANTDTDRIGPASRFDELRHRRHPYAEQPGDDEATRAAISQAIGQAIADTQGIIHHLLRRGLTQQDADRNDAAQTIAVHLWRTSLPRFDASRGVKLSTYLYRCTQRHVLTIRRDMARQQHKRNQGKAIIAGPLDTTEACRTAAPDKRHDARVAEIIEDIRADPTSYFLDGQANVMAAYLATIETEQAKVAAAIGYRNPASLCAMLARAKEELFAHFEGIDDWESRAGQ